ncbi:MAG: hypothetical protein ACRYGB_08160 [Janthinobacterium lividum]
MRKPIFHAFLLMIVLQICNTSTIFAQQGFILKGVIFQKQSDFRVSNAFILNLKNKLTVNTDYTGAFTIKVTLGDTLKITKKDYSDNYYVVENQKDAIIQLSQVIQLNEVRIVGQSKKQELDEAMRQYRGQGSFYNGKPPALAAIASPITGLYELFGKTPGQARRFQAFSKTETEQINIDKRFNAAIVKQNTDLTDAQIEVFMNTFRPSYDQLIRWNEYDLINYIKASAKQLKDGKAPPPLKKLY